MAEAEGIVGHCRVWLPEDLCVAPQQERRLAMVGWVSEGADFLDMVVVAGVPTCEDFSGDVTGLQRCLDSAELKLPAKLRTQRKLCIIGEYRRSSENENEKSQIRSVDVTAESKYLQDNYRTSASLKSSQLVNRAWALFVGHSCCGTSKKLDWVPNLYRIIRDECYVAPLSNHIIIYNQPRLGSHHYSCLPWSSSHKVPDIRGSGKHVVNKPIWLSTMEQQKTPLNMEMIMMKLNCARFISQSIKEDVATSLQSDRKRAVHHVKLPRRPMAMLITLWATFLYCLAQGLTPFLSVWLPAVPVLRKLTQKSMLVKIMHIRCQQLMAWPFMLLWGDLGPEQPNVASANRVTISKHSTWFSLLIDNIGGAIVGCLVLNYRSAILSFLIDSGQCLTNDVLRTGSVWLMGVPAGFKINTELAAVFGTLSLHWIQTWSTLLFTSIPAINILLFVLGLSGIVMGFTVFASLVSDMLSLSTIHVLSLHDAIGFIYSNQLRALAALFRLFRGRKRNALRGRLDSFDCSVEQLLVGSLMFTPLLLLLPTTSVFYTFFSIVLMTVSSIQLSIHYLISIILSFPFCELATWFLHPKHFPSGVWMRKVQLEKTVMKTSTNSKSPISGKGFQKDIYSTSILSERSKSGVPDQRVTGDFSSEMEAIDCRSRDCPSIATAEMYSTKYTRIGKQTTTLLTTLEIRATSFGELLRPFLETHYSGLQWPSAATLAYEIVSGSVGNSVLVTFPHFLIPRSARKALPGSVIQLQWDSWSTSALLLYIWISDEKFGLEHLAPSNPDVKQASKPGCRYALLEGIREHLGTLCQVGSSEFVLKCKQSA